MWYHFRYVFWSDLSDIKITFPVWSPRKTENWHSRSCQKMGIYKTHRLELVLCARTTLMTDLLSVCVHVYACVCLKLAKWITAQDECYQVMFAPDNFKAPIARSVVWRNLINIYRLTDIHLPLTLLYEGVLYLKHYGCNLMWLCSGRW